MKDCRHLLILALLGSVLVAGCSSGNGSSQTVPYRTYHDARYKFSFRYPGSWSVTNGRGHMTTISGVQTYVVDITTPHNAEGVQVTVDRNMAASDYSSIPEGKVAPYGGDTLHYHHVTVSGWPSIQIERYNGKTLDGIFTITNTNNYSYEVQMIAATPPFSAGALAAYHSMVQSLKLPF